MRAIASPEYVAEVTRLFGHFNREMMHDLFFSPMRTITTHKVNGLNEAVEITANAPGSGGAPTRYDIIGEAEHIDGFGPRHFGVNLRFQSKPIQSPKDYDGITNEALLAVLIDRMEGFQSGPFKCRENAIALTHMEEAMMWLQKRTRDRMARGVEGTLKP